MQQTLGGMSATNFQKSQTFEYSSGKIDYNTPSTTIDPNLIANEVLKTIGSLNKHPEEVNLETDPNPLDNIIRDEVVTLLNFRKLNKVDIQYALDQHALGNDPSPGFSAEEHIILLTQARDLEYITEAQYLDWSSNPSTFWFNDKEAYLKTLNFQLSLPNNVPTIEELKVAGIVQFIIDTVKANPEAVIDENLVKKYTEDYINNILLSSEFIGYEKAQKIYADPTYLMSILDKTTLKYFLYRVKPYLAFITDENINAIMDWLPSQYPNITSIFSATQIRLMVDKELDIKNLILKTLTISEVQKTFNDLATKFKEDFKTAFTNEKLMELIQLTINTMYPVPTTEDIYKHLSEVFNVTIDTNKINSIENYLLNY